MDEKTEVAIELITSEISKIMDKYAFEKNTDKSKKLKEKLDFLQELRSDIYLNNETIIEFIIRKYKNGEFNEK